MDLKGIMLNEISQREKDKYMISLTCGILKKKKNKFTDTKNRLVGTRGRGGNGTGKMGEGNF